jgi:hypothetical protein
VWVGDVTVKHTLKLPLVTTKDGRRYTGSIELTIEVRKKTNSNGLTIDLERTPSELVCVSLVGSTYRNQREDCGGQCQDTIAQIWANEPSVQRIVALWERWHLNDMRAGTRAQEEYLRQYRPAYLPPYSYYDAACVNLTAAKLHPDRDYRYGSQWLYEDVPQEVLDELVALFAQKELVA